MRSSIEGVRVTMTDRTGRLNTWLTMHDNSQKTGNQVSLESTTPKIENQTCPREVPLASRVTPSVRPDVGAVSAIIALY